MIAFSSSNIAKIEPHMDFFNIMTYNLMKRRDTVTKNHAGIVDSVERVKRYIENGVLPRKAIVGFGFYAKWFEIVPLKELDAPIPSPIGIPTVQMEDPNTGADLGVPGAFVWCENPKAQVAASFERAMAQGRYDDRFKGHYFLDDEENMFWSWETPEANIKKFKTLKWSWDLGGVFA